MPDLKGSAASAIAAVSDTTRFLVSHGGVDGIALGSQLEDYIGVAQRNVAVADQVIGASTTAYITNSGLLVPTAKMRIGTLFRWQLAIAKSAAGTAALSFIVKVGTAGTTADTTRLTFTTGTQTAVADEAIVDILVTCRGPLSASGIFEGTMRLTHELAITGFSTKAMEVKRVQSAAFDVTTASLIVGLALTTGASHSITIRQSVVEALNL